MRLIELPARMPARISSRDPSTQESEDPEEEESILDNLPMAELETKSQAQIEPEKIPSVTDIRGRILRNTDARRANASLAKQIAHERTILV